MNNLIVKQIEFNGDNLIAAKDNDSGKVYIGISYICNGLGLNKNHKDRQIKNVQGDIVLNRGCVKFEAGVFDPNNETLALEIDYLPLWLAKISITPKMKSENPQVVLKLINYQLKAKDVLAKAFVYGELDLPTNYKDALKQLIFSIEKNEQLETTISVLKPKAELADTLTDAKNYFSFLQASKALKICGRNKLMKRLRDMGILMDGVYSRNIPYEQYITAGYFKVNITQRYINGVLQDIHTTLITPKGLAWIYKMLTGEKLVKSA